MRRIGILGGTFNPVHYGHLLMAENALEQLELDEVLFAPAGDPPHKGDDDLIGTRDRVELVELAIAGRTRFRLSRIDLDHEGPSYTWRMLERCHQAWPGTGFHFILGGDSLSEFHTWARPDRVLELARIAVIPRPDVPFDDAAIDRVPGLRDRLDVVDVPLCAVSATEIRRRVAAGQSIRYLLPEDVRQRILSAGFYREGNAVPGA
jgi:nicotinate-nucleotide adenylyltransferase